MLAGERHLCVPLEAGDNEVAVAIANNFFG